MARAGLGENPPYHQDSDDDRGDTRAKRQRRGAQPDPDSAPVHQPFAWSTISALNGGAPGGVIWKDSPHLPTITSAGAARE